MRHSANSRHDVDGSRGRIGGLLPGTGLASTPSFSGAVSAMDRPPPPAAATFSCYEPPPTPVTFLSPPSLPPPPSIYHPGDLRYCQPPSLRQHDVQATPPYLVGDGRFPPGGEVQDRSTSVYAGRYVDSTMVDSAMRAVLLPGVDGIVQSPAALTPPPLSLFGWRGTQTSCASSLSGADHAPGRHFQSYYSGIVLDQPFCRSPVGADPAVDVCETLLPATGANTVRALPRESRRRVNGNLATLSTSAFSCRRQRTNFTTDQLRHLRQCFADCQYIDVHQRREISTALGLTEQQVKVWFQNQRSKMKRLQQPDDRTSRNTSTDIFT